MSSTIAITSNNFESEVLRSPIPVLLDFWSPGCVPCLMLAPILDELAREYAEYITIAKVNADEEISLANRFAITAVPALLVFRNGEILRKRIGALPKPQVEDLFKDMLQPFTAVR